MHKRVPIYLAAALAIILILVFVIGQQGVLRSRQKRQAAQALYDSANAFTAQGKLPEAALAYQNLIAQYPDFSQITDAERKMWDLNIQLLFSPAVTENDFIYKVEPGDSLIKIAAKYNTTVDLLMRSNDLQTNLIRPGRRLKVSGAKYSVIVDKSQDSLTLKANDAIFKVYPVTTGKLNCTPVGVFTIAEKLKNPDWYKEGAGIVAASSPENILGTRWLGLSEPHYGIHGGARQEDLGKQVTEGCVRMLNPDVEELFTILPRGSEVTIVE